MSVHKPGATWFQAQLKPNSAKIAQKNLERQGFETFLPLEEEPRDAGGNRTVVRLPFPGYIVERFDAAQGLGRAINSTSCITGLTR